MVRAAALIAAMGLALPCVAQISDHTKALNMRAEVIIAASDPKLKDARVIIGRNDGGSVWKVRVSDLAPIYQMPSQYPHTWVFVDHAADKTVKARESRMRIAIRCKESQFAILMLVDYAADGRVLRTEDWPDIPATYSDIIPETMAEAGQKALCPLD